MLLDILPLVLFQQKQFLIDTLRHRESTCFEEAFIKCAAEVLKLQNGVFMHAMAAYTGQLFFVCFFFPMEPCVNVCRETELTD